jgi:hypothetical protein
MANPQIAMYEEESNQIQGVVDRLVKDANAKVVFIIDKNENLIAASGVEILCPSIRLCGSCRRNVHSSIYVTI